MGDSSIIISPAKTLILFGGGASILDFALASKRRGLKTYVFAVTRHLDEIINDDTSLTLKRALQNNEVPFYHVSNINDSPELKTIILDNKACMGIGLGEAYTFTQETIDLFEGRLFDFMVIRLPQYRGGAHFTWQILRKNRIGCWNIQVINTEMVPGVFDSGQILKTREYVIPQGARIPQDYFRVALAEALKLFVEFMDEIDAGKEFKLARLQENFSVYFPRLNTIKHAFINWSWNTGDIETFICAFDDPYAGASTFLNGERVFIKDCQADYTEGGFHPFMSGLIYRVHGNVVFVATKDCALVFRKVCDEKGKDMISGLKVGQRFYTPVKYLEEAMLFNAEYDTEGPKQKEK